MPCKYQEKDNKYLCISRVDQLATIDLPPYLFHSEKEVPHITVRFHNQSRRSKSMQILICDNTVL